jgi:hypothetical protein
VHVRRVGTRAAREARGSSRRRWSCMAGLSNHSAGPTRDSALPRRTQRCALPNCRAAPYACEAGHGEIGEVRLMGWRDALNGALDVLAPGSPSATTEVEADGNFFTRLDRHWRNAYAELGTPPRDVATGYTSRAHSHGLELIRRGRAAEAERVLRALSDSGNAGARTDLGVLHFRAGVLNLAEQEWQQAAGQGDIRAAHYLGVLLVQRGRRTEAEQWLRRALCDRRHLRQTRACPAGTCAYNSTKASLSAPRWHTGGCG